jgi:hypothetical protein
VAVSGQIICEHDVARPELTDCSIADPYLGMTR